MKKIVIGVVVALVAVSILGAAGLAYAQGQNPPAATPNTGSTFVGYGRGMMGQSSQSGSFQGRGPANRGGRFNGQGVGMLNAGSGLLHDYIVAAFANELNLSVDTIESRLASGETMAQIAYSEGLTQDEFSTLMLSARQSALEQAVSDGVITQEQADWMQSRQNRMFGNGFGPGSGACMSGVWNQ